MPVNEILAPVYTEVTYRTGAGQSHKLRLYFATGSTITPPPPGAEDPNDYVLLGTEVPAGFSIKQVVAEVLSRRPTAYVGLGGGITVTQILNFASAPGANTFINVNSNPSGPIGSGTAIASAYLIGVAQSADRSKAKFTLLDTITVGPERSSWPAPPAEDDNSLGWYLIRRGVPFATNDGKRLVQLLTLSQGYNKKLARKYGFNQTP